MTHCVNPAMKPMQPSRIHPTPNTVLVDPRLRKLRSRHDTVLSRRDLRDPPVTRGD